MVRSNPMLQRTASLLALSLAMASLLAACSEPMSTAARKAQELDAREAVFRHQFENNGSALKSDAKVYCVGFEAVDPKTGPTIEDPDDAFIQRFSGNIPTVKKYSSCDYRDKVGLLDKASGERALEFTTSNISWISETEMQMEGGYFEASLSASGNTFRLKRIDGKWAVVQARENWIS